MLTSEERADVQLEFGYALSDSEAPRTLIRALFTASAEHRVILDRVGGSNSLPLAAATLDECLLSGWSRTPSMLARLLDYLIEQRGIGSFAWLLERVNKRIDPNLSFYADTWLLDNTRPFFDRHDLRKKSQLLIEGNGRPILRLIKVGDSYGRSYTQSFFAHLDERRGGDVCVIAAEIPEGGGPSYTVGNLLNQVRAALSCVEPLPEQTRSSYPEDAVLWLLRLLKPGPRWVLVLDGFGQEAVPNEVHEVVRLLARSVTKAQYRRRVRLVLLDYPPVIPGLAPMSLLAETLPGVPLADILTETLPPVTALGQADLLPCLQAWDRLRMKQGMAGLADDELAKLADGLLAKAPPSGKARLERLHYDLLMLLEMPGRGLDGAI